MILVQDVLVSFPEEMAEQEAQRYAKEEIERWQGQGKVLDRVVLELDGADVVIKAFEKSPIKRVRRITGYLANVDSFNDAKRAELAARVSHA